MKKALPKIAFTFQSLLAEHGVEALRSTLTGMVPAVIIAFTAGLDYAIPFVIGALNASLTDFPGHRQEKLQAAFLGIVCFLSISFVIGFSLPNTPLLIGLIGLFAGVFTLFSALGPRIGMIGTTSLFLITFIMGLKPVDVIQFSIFVGLGTAWFFFVNMLHALIDPLWELRRAIGNGYRTTGLLLRAKALCYDERISLDQLYHRVAAISIKLADQQETVRHLLLRERFHLRDGSTKAYALWLRAYVLMDIYGMATALDHDYELIRERLMPIGALPMVHELVLLVAEGMEIASRKNAAEGNELRALEEKITALLAVLLQKQQQAQGDESSMLAGSIANGRSFLTSISQLRKRQGDELMEEFYANSLDLTGFLPPISTGVKDLFKHVQTYSPLFMFAIRMVILFLIGGLLGELLSDMKYTYWILITIIVVARPSYLLTKQRNKERLSGTFWGALLGLAIIFLFSNTYVLLLLISALLFGFLLFNKRYYTVSVFFITALVIVTLHLHDDTWTDVLLNRGLFTLLGCGLALLGWFLVPVRQEKSLQPLAMQALQAQRDYFETVERYVASGLKGERYAIRLARKRAFLDLTKFSDAILQSRPEPRKGRNRSKIGSTLHIDLYRLHAMISSSWIKHNQNVLLPDHEELLSIDSRQRMEDVFEKLTTQLDQRV